MTISDATLAELQQAQRRFQKETEHSLSHAQLDAKRQVARLQMLEFLQRFLDGKIDVVAFKTDFDKRTRNEWNVFGIKGLSGAMFLNTLVKHIPDLNRLTQSLIEVLPLPSEPSESTGREKMKRFSQYLNEQIAKKIITGGQVQPARIPFFVSAWWHMQAMETWPIYYVSGKNALQTLGIFTPSADVIQDYFAFRNRFLALTSQLSLDPWSLEHLLAYVVKEEQTEAVIPPVDVPSLLPAEPAEPIAAKPTVPAVVPSEASEELNHAHIQYLLATIGQKLGCKVWIAANDHNRAWNGQRLGDLSLLTLPMLGLNNEVQKIISLIDVIWLQKSNQVMAAFEVEHTTSIYSGLLRMADLVAASPNLNFPLYIVAPDERIDKVRRELERPAFQALGLHEQCGFFSFGTLQEETPAILRWASEPKAIDRLAQRVGSIHE